MFLHIAYLMGTYLCVLYTRQFVCKVPRPELRALCSRRLSLEQDGGKNERAAGAGAFLTWPK